MAICDFIPWLYYVEIAFNFVNLLDINLLKIVTFACVRVYQNAGRAGKVCVYWRS